MAMSGTMRIPCYELIGSVCSVRHTNQAADRTSQLQAIGDCEFLCEIGETSPLGSRSTVSSTRLWEFGAEAIEYDLTAKYPSAAVKRRSTCWPAT